MRPTGDDLDVRARLRALRTDPPPGDFQAALRRKLLAAGPPQPASAWERVREHLRAPALAWTTAAVAAGVAAFLLLAPARPGRDAPAPAGGAPSAGTLLPATRVAVVRLNLSADVPVDAARIRVTLPPGLTFWAEGAELAQRSFEWTQALAVGDNEIPIAVRGRNPGRYRIAVDARIGEQQVEDEIWIEVVGG